jgi:hypothetical protein
MNKRQLAAERAAAHGRVRKPKNAYVPKQRTEAERDALFAELVSIAQHNLRKRK